MVTAPFNKEPDMVEVNATMQVNISSDDLDTLVRQVMHDIVYDAYGYSSVDKEYYRKLRRAARVVHNHFCVPAESITKDQLKEIESCNK